SSRGATAWYASTATPRNRSRPPPLCSGRLPAVLFLVVRLEPRDDPGIGERRRVAERLAFGDVAEQATHDFSRARLREIRGEPDVVGPRDGAALLPGGIFHRVGAILRL